MSTPSRSRARRRSSVQFEQVACQSFADACQVGQLDAGVIEERFGGLPFLRAETRPARIERRFGRGAVDLVELGLHFEQRHGDSAQSCECSAHHLLDAVTGILGAVAYFLEGFAYVVSGSYSVGRVGGYAEAEVCHLAFTLRTSTSRLRRRILRATL